MYPQKTTFKRKSLFSKAGLMCALIGVSCKKVYLDTVRQLKYWSRHPNSLFWFLHSAFPISLSPCLPIFSFPPLFNTVSPLLPITLSPCPHLFFSISFYFSIWFCVFPSPQPRVSLSPPPPIFLSFPHSTDPHTSPVANMSQMLSQTCRKGQRLFLLKR
jgi:hypothetical protein